MAGINEITKTIIGVAFSVHQELGPGLYEGAYETVMATGMRGAGLYVQRQLVIPVTYNGERIIAGFKADLIVEQKVIIELKSRKQLQPMHIKQLMTYLRLSGFKVGLLLNFGGPSLGIKRLVNGLEEEDE